MKSQGRRAFVPGEAALIGIHFLESRQLLSATGKAADIAEIDRSPAIAAAATPAERSSSDAADAASTPNAESPTARAIPVLASAAADVATSVGDAKESESGDSPTRTGAVSAQVVGSSLAGVGLVAGASGTVEQSPGDEASTSGIATATAGDPTGDAASLGAGALPGSATGGVPSGYAQASPPTSMAARSSAPANGGPASLPAGTGPAETEGETHGVLLAVDAVPTATGTVRVASSRIRMTTVSELVGRELTPAVEDEAAEPRAVDESSPLPRAADLLTEFLPFDRAKLEDAIDSFLAPLEGMTTELASWSSSSKWLPAATLVVGAAVATEAARRRIRLSRATDEEGEGDLALIPGGPDSWRLAEA